MVFFILTMIIAYFVFVFKIIEKYLDLKTIFLI